MGLRDTISVAFGSGLLRPSKTISLRILSISFLTMWAPTSNLDMQNSQHSLLTYRVLVINSPRPFTFKEVLLYSNYSKSNGTLKHITLPYMPKQLLSFMITPIKTGLQASQE